ncbi:flagellar basal body P-ring formation chaperone FlgA [Alphaproteobacteria bacterium]|nr:flagellar basal body P-ring formation chaperone FlgA [Alphaproteobacteria bacterium]
MKTTLKYQLTGLAMTVIVILGTVMSRSTATSAAETVHLRKSVTVTSEQILLSDIFTGLGGIGDAVIADAPAPGTKLNLGPRELRRIVKQYDLPWHPARGQQLVRIARATRTIPLKTVRLALSDALMDGHVTGDVDIELTNRRLNMLVAANRDLSVRVHDMNYDPQTRRFSALLSAPANDPNAPRKAVKGRIYALVDLPVTRRHIRPGEVIKAQDIGWRSVRANQSTYNTINSLDELIGQSARRPLVAGRLIKHTDVKPRELVAKGDFVTVHFRSQTMSLSYRGVAMESGARNDVIRIRNPRSKKVIEGKVIGPNVAAIQLPKYAALN